MIRDVYIAFLLDETTMRDVKIIHPSSYLKYIGKTTFTRLDFNQLPVKMITIHLCSNDIEF